MEEAHRKEKWKSEQEQGLKGEAVSSAHTLQEAALVEITAYLFSSEQLL